MSSQIDQKKRLAELEREYAEAVASLPKHSVKASQLMRIEELEDEIAALRAALGIVYDPHPHTDEA